MKKLKLILGFAFAALLTGHATQAVMINGGVAIAGSPTSVTATDVIMAPGINAVVTSSSGDYAGAGILPFLSMAEQSSFTFAPFTGPIDPIWSIGGLASFRLDSLVVISNDGSGDVVLTGAGVASLVGFDPTPGLWSFSADNTGSTFAFSSTASVRGNKVPDSGASAVLLGLGLIGLAGATRRFKK